MIHIKPSVIALGQPFWMAAHALNWGAIHLINAVGGANGSQWWWCLWGGIVSVHDGNPIPFPYKIFAAGVLVPTQTQIGVILSMCMCQEEIHGEQGDAAFLLTVYTRGVRRQCACHTSPCVAIRHTSSRIVQLRTHAIADADETHGPSRTQKPVSHLVLCLLSRMLYDLLLSHVVCLCIDQ